MNRRWNFKTQVLSLFGLEKRRLRRNFIDVYRMEGSERDLARPISVLSSERARGNGQKLKTRKFYLKVFVWLFSFSSGN